MIKKLVLALALIAALSIGVSAQEDDTARARAVNLVWDAPPLQAYADGAALGAPIAPGNMTDYLDVPAATYEIAFAPEGDDASASVISPFDFEVESGHDYTVILRGSTAEGTVETTVLDETEAAEGIDPETETPLVFINELSGVPAVTLWVDDEAILENIAFGESTTATLPVGSFGAVTVTAADDPENVLLAPPFFVDSEFPPDVAWLLGAVGTYPGEPGVDRFLYAIPVFKGELSYADSGAVEAGTPVEGTLAVGERIQYTLTLDDDATLDISLAASEDSALDSVVRVYDADGELVGENDEIDFEDESLDAGLSGLELAAGEYVIEVASYGDSSSGGYTLTIETAA